jgi:hypothetical protein
MAYSRKLGQCSEFVLSKPVKEYGLVKVRSCASNPSGHINQVVHIVREAGAGISYLGCVQGMAGCVYIASPPVILLAMFFPIIGGWIALFTPAISPCSRTHLKNPRKMG